MAKNKEHVIKVGLKKGELTLSRHSVVVGIGDTITWTLTKGRVAPFAVIVPSFVPPLSWSCKAKKGHEIKGKVRKSAVPGIYPYAVSLCDGDKLLVVDPDIIIPPPKGGR